MNSRFEAHSLEPSNSQLIDRLVAGSLPEADRRTLLVQLETEPDGWRQCALAFLEAQAWREAFAPLTASAAAMAVQPKLPTSRSAVKPSQIAVRWAAIAVSLLVAFTLGRTFKHVEPPEVPHEVVRETLPLPANPSVASPPEANAVAEAKRIAPEPSASSLYADAVVKTLQTKGYSAERQNTHVMMTLEDGSERKVPAQEIRVHYVGGRTY